MGEKSFLVVNIFLIFMLSFINAQVPELNLGEDDSSSGINIILDSIPEGVTFNNDTGSVNSSDFWDNLDTPTDITNSEFWYNHTLHTFNIYNSTWDQRGGYVPYTGAIKSIDLGTHDFNTTGTIKGSVYSRFGNGDVYVRYEEFDLSGIGYGEYPLLMGYSNGTLGNRISLSSPTAILSNTGINIELSFLDEGLTNDASILFNISDDRLDFIDANEGYTFDADVGIGTILPSHELNVVGNSNITIDSYIEDDLFVSDDAIVLGQVGVGTSTPIATASLHVAGGDLSVDNNEWQKFLRVDGLDDGTGFYRTTSNAFFLRFHNNSFIYHSAHDRDIRYWGSDNQNNYNYKFVIGTNDWNAQQKNINFRFRGQDVTNLFYLDADNSTASVGGDLYVSGDIYYSGGMLSEGFSMFTEDEDQFLTQIYYINKINNSEFGFTVVGEYKSESDKNYSIQISSINATSLYRGIGCIENNSIEGYCTYFKWSNDNGASWSGNIITSPSIFEIDDGIKFGFNCPSNICNFTVGDEFNFTAVSNPIDIFKIDTINNQISSEVGLFNITNSLLIGGNTNLSLDDEVWISDGTNYLKIYDYGGLGVPLIKGQSSIFGSVISFQDMVQVISISNDRPSIWFYDPGGDSSSYIHFNGTTNEILFEDAERYSFDNKINISMIDPILSLYDSNVADEATILYNGSEDILYIDKNLEMQTSDLIISQDQKVCFDGSTCSHYLSYNGTCIQNGSTCIA